VTDNITLMKRDSFDREFRLDDAYSIGIVETYERFMALKDAWDNLVEKHGAHEPFLCHDWFRIWLKHFQGNAKLFILFLCRENSPILIAPFIRKKERYKRISSVQKIELIGNINSPIKDVIFGETDSQARREAMLRLFAYLKTGFSKWDILEFDAIPEETFPCSELSNMAIELGFKARNYCSFSDWYMDGINYSSQGYFNRLPKKIRDELKRRQKRISELGEVMFEIGADSDHFNRYMDQYDQVRARSWKSPERHKSFLRDCREMAARNGALRCGFLYLNSLPIAAQIRIVANGTAYFMEALHDKHYDKYGPGNLLRAKVIEHLIDGDHITVIDQIRGDEPYKEYWTPFKRERYGVSIFNKTLKGYFFNFIMLRLLPIIRNNHA
jgi:CelD/BcsL family acetyltransferase involved in cellulose biosynthesis